MEEPKSMTLKAFEKKCLTPEMSDKYYPKFEKEAKYLGHGVYCWHNITASDTRDLFLLGVAVRLNILIKN